MQMPGCEMEGGDEGEWRQLMAESIISLKHVASAVSAMDASISKDLTYCICYLSKTSYIVFAKQYWNSQNVSFK